MKQIYIIAGPNGSGKTIFAKELIRKTNLPFLNADEIALEMSNNGDVGRVRLQAGKEFFKKLNKYIDNQESFVVETTLSGKYFVRVIDKLRKQGYKISITFIFVENCQEAIRRIKYRMAKGGHHVPDEDVIRRFTRSIKNFWNIYKNKVDSWKIYFNSEDGFRLTAVGEQGKTSVVLDELLKQFKLKV